MYLKFYFSNVLKCFISQMYLKFKFMFTPWLVKFPLGKCSDPSRSTNARIIGSEFYHGRQVEFVCPRDSSLVPEKSRKLTCLDGRWDGVIPVCKGIRNIDILSPQIALSVWLKIKNSTNFCNFFRLYLLHIITQVHLLHKTTYFCSFNYTKAFTSM